MEAEFVSELISAGSGGLVIVVVILFLRFLSVERNNRTEQHEKMMCFMAEQRESNNRSVARAAKIMANAQDKASKRNADTCAQVVNVVSELTAEIIMLKESHIIHDVKMSTALDIMREDKASLTKEEISV